MTPYQSVGAFGRGYVVSTFNSAFQRLTPLALVLAGGVGLFILFYSGEPRLAAESTGAQVTGRTVDFSGELALQQQAMAKLASKVDALSEEIRRTSEIHENSGSVRGAMTDIDKMHAVSATATKQAAVKGRVESRANAGAPSRPAVEEDLDKLRTYIKDVADSVALLDAEVSNPAVLQKKLEHEKAIAQR